MSDRVLIAAQVLVTLALLGFAYLMEDRSPGMSNMIVGAALAHWLRESVQLGQDVRDRRRQRRGT